MTRDDKERIYKEKLRRSVSCSDANFNWKWIALVLYFFSFPSLARHYISRCIGSRHMANGKYWLRLYASTTNTIRYERCVLRVWSCPIDVVLVWTNRLPSDSASRRKRNVNRRVTASLAMFLLLFFQFIFVKTNKVLETSGIEPIHLQTFIGHIR